MWYRNRARAGRKKFLKPWCGPWKVVKVLSDVTYRIEEETRRPGRRRHRRVVHFNYLKPCHSPPQEALSPTASSRRSQEPGSGEVELGWLENSASPVTDVVHCPEVLVGNGTPISDPVVADNPSQPLVVSVSSGAQVAELSQTRVRQRREIREPAWLKGASMAQRLC